MPGSAEFVHREVRIRLDGSPANLASEPKHGCITRRLPHRRREARSLLPSSDAVASGRRDFRVRSGRTRGERRTRGVVAALKFRGVGLVAAVLEQA